VALTIAAIILISGLYIRFGFASDGNLVSEPYTYYENMKESSFGIGPMGTKLQTFEGHAGEKISLRLFVNPSSQGQMPANGPEPLPRIQVNVTDSSGKRLAYDENVGRNYSIQPIEIENEGQVSVGLRNLEDQPIDVTMHIGKGRTQQPFDNGMENFSNWLMIVSAPIFGLGIWLLIPKRNKEQPDSSTPI